MAPHTALVTGAGTGIGRGVALAMARRGIRVALVGRLREPLDGVAKEIRLAAKAPLGVVIPADLAEAAERAMVVRQVHAALGSVDILVNNAGVLAGGELSSLSQVDVERAVAVNLTAPIDLARLLYDDLVAGHGSVAFIASNVRFIPLPSMTLYTATKSSLANLAISLRYEWEPLGIRVLVVYPPDTNTEMLAGMRAGDSWRNIPLASPEEVGERIVAAVGEQSSELRWGTRERLLVALYQTFPWLGQAVIRLQRRHFAYHLPPVANKDSSQTSSK